MRPALWTAPAACVLFASCMSVREHHPEHDHHVAQRTPLPRVHPPFTLERAGHPDTIAPWAIGSVTRYEAGGYVGGGSIKASQPLRRRTDEAGAPGDGTFGLDFVGFRSRPGRVFLAPSADPADGVPIANNYKTDVHFPKDVFNIRPVRKAILERREEREHHEEAPHE